MKPLHHIFSIIAFLAFQKISAQAPVVFDNTDSISHLIMPNVFTPNYDSVNDVFKPILDEITELKFSIFNRYGILIFETDRLHGFWDGRTTSGEPCTDGVYFCVLTGTGIDGKKYKEKTSIHLFANDYNKQ